MLSSPAIAAQSPVFSGLVPKGGNAAAFAGALQQAQAAQAVAGARSGKGLDLGGLKQVGFAPMKPAPGDDKLTPEQRNLKTAARELEAVFVNQLVTIMRATHIAKDPLAQGAGNDTFRALMDTQMSRDMASRGSLGLADVIYRELVRGLPDAKAEKPETRQDQGLAPSRP